MSYLIVFLQTFKPDIKQEKGTNFKNIFMKNSILSVRLNVYITKILSCRNSVSSKNCLSNLMYVLQLGIVQGYGSWKRCNSKN